MAAVKVSVVALRHICCCPGAIRDCPVRLDYPIAEWLRLSLFLCIERFKKAQEEKKL
jgi:hypothetical protein